MRIIIIFGGSGFIGGNFRVLAQNTGWDADIDQAEREKELAYKVNVGGAKHVAESCARFGIRYVLFSSDAVFDGEKSGYKEEDPEAPVNYYGQTKKEAEKAVLQVCPGATAIRISFVLGYPIETGNSFFANLESKLKDGQEIYLPTDEIRTPIDVYPLSECVLELCENEFHGILHIGATDSISRFDLTRQLTLQMGCDVETIKPQTTPEKSVDRAPRHKSGIINVTKAQGLLNTRLPSTTEFNQRAFKRK